MKSPDKVTNTLAGSILAVIPGRFVSTVNRTAKHVFSNNSNTWIKYTFCVLVRYVQTRALNLVIVSTISFSFATLIHAILKGCMVTPICTVLIPATGFKIF